eukprot:TRINITY_DN11403_c0_g2_i1.p1 TRINITY_DN11403_c0_g2~~TRINITY_DN11403_c0_g2_i1.p1  ORF type:complete len:1261 (-),score=268.72 TRINITY_DN11403_c0_g2_i1:78-3860(-)
MDDVSIITEKWAVKRGGNKIRDEYILDTSPHAQQKIGAGSFGKVFRAVRREDAGAVAVKLVPKFPELPTRGPRSAMRFSVEALRKVEQKHLQRTREEAELMHVLKHPNIVTLREIYEDCNSIYIVMDMYSGGEVVDFIIDCKFYTEAHVAILMGQVFRAVSYLHVERVCHRDIKPENILLESRAPIENNCVKVVDFSISCRCEVDEDLKTVAGTPHFLAPQVVAGRYNLSCDLWSCGATAYVLLCGYPPFNRATEAGVMDLIRHGNYRFFDDEWSSVSEDAKDLIRKLLCMDPKERYDADRAGEHVWIRERAPNALDTWLQAGLKNLKAYQRQHRVRVVSGIPYLIDQDEAAAIEAKQKAKDDWFSDFAKRWMQTLEPSAADVEREAHDAGLCAYLELSGSRLLPPAKLIAPKIQKALEAAMLALGLPAPVRVFARPSSAANPVAVVKEARGKIGEKPSEKPSEARCLRIGVAPHEVYGTQPVLALLALEAETNCRSQLLPRIAAALAGTEAVPPDCGGLQARLELDYKAEAAKAKETFELNTTGDRRLGGPRALRGMSPTVAGADSEEPPEELDDDSDEILAEGTKEGASHAALPPPVVRVASRQGSPLVRLPGVSEEPVEIGASKGVQRGPNKPIFRPLSKLGDQDEPDLDDLVSLLEQEAELEADDHPASTTVALHEALKATSGAETPSASTASATDTGSSTTATPCPSSDVPELVDKTLPNEDARVAETADETIQDDAMSKPMSVVVNGHTDLQHDAPPGDGPAGALSLPETREDQKPATAPSHPLRSEVPDNMQFMEDRAACEAERKPLCSSTSPTSSAGGPCDLRPMQDSTAGASSRDPVLDVQQVSRRYESGPAHDQIVVNAGQLDADTFMDSPDAFEQPLVRRAALSSDEAVCRSPPRLTTPPPLPELEMPLLDGNAATLSAAVFGADVAACSGPRPQRDAPETGNDASFPVQHQSVDTVRGRVTHAVTASLEPDGEPRAAVPPVPCAVDVPAQAPAVHDRKMSEASGYIASCAPSASSLARAHPDDASMQCSQFSVGGRVEVHYESVWYEGTVMGKPDEDPGQLRRWTVQCDVDPVGTVTYSLEIRSLAARVPEAAEAAAATGSSAGGADALQSPRNGAADVRYLPISKDGLRILIPAGTEPYLYTVDDSELRSGQPSLRYRLSKCFEDVDFSRPGPHFGSLVRGVDAADGWLQMNVGAALTTPPVGYADSAPCQPPSSDCDGVSMHFSEETGEDETLPSRPAMYRRRASG